VKREQLQAQLDEELKKKLTVSFYWCRILKCASPDKNPR
jgi:hypothetical protein